MNPCGEPHPARKNKGQISLMVRCRMITRRFLLRSRTEGANARNAIHHTDTAIQPMSRIKSRQNRQLARRTRSGQDFFGSTAGMLLAPGSSQLLS